MKKDYPSITKEILSNMKEMKGSVPGVMEGFYALSQAATLDGALDEKTKELIALAIGVIQGCDGCIGFHTQKLKKLGATSQEVAEAMGVCVYMGGGPALMRAADAVGAFNDLN